MVSGHAAARDGAIYQGTLSGSLQQAIRPLWHAPARDHHNIAGTPARLARRPANEPHGALCPP